MLRALTRWRERGAFLRRAGGLLSRLRVLRPAAGRLAAVAALLAALLAASVALPSAHAQERVPDPPRNVAAVLLCTSTFLGVSLTWDTPDETGDSPVTHVLVRREHVRDGGVGTERNERSVSVGSLGGVNRIADLRLQSGRRYEYRLALRNSAGAGAWSERVSQTPRTECPNNAPAFAAASLTRSVAENTAANTNVGDPIPAATDADPGDTLTYTMAGTDASSFTFDASARQIKTRQGVTYDHEAKSRYAVSVKVSDGTASDTVAVAIDITDVAEPPAKPAAPTVSGASTASVDVSWSAPANAGRPAIASYDLRYRAGGGGQWSAGPQDRTGTAATISGLTAGTSYEVQVRATNAEGDSPWSDPGTGSTNTGGTAPRPTTSTPTTDTPSTDAPSTDTPSNNAPAFAAASLTRSVAENTAANTNVGDPIPAATDADPGDTLTYTMEGTDASSFTFDASARQIKTRQGVTYDHEAKSRYAVSVKVSDGTASDTVAVAIDITDVAEPPAKPAAPTVSGASTASVDVSWSAPANAGRPAIASYDLRYRAGGGGRWSAGPQDRTGTAATISGLTAGTSYEVQVRATNAEGDSPWSDPGTGSTNTGGTAPRPTTSTPTTDTPSTDTPTNDAPAFGAASLTRSVAENTAANTNVGDPIPAATDADPDDTLTYTMAGPDASSFTFDASARQIKTRQGVTYDHEAKSRYAVSVKVSDGTASDTVAVAIDITDVAEPPAKPAAPTVSGASTASVDVSWSAPANTGRPAIASYDLRYRAGSGGRWSAGPQDRTGTAATISGLTAGTSYEVQVRATNAEGDSPWSDPGTGSTDARPDPQAWLARFGRTVTGQVLDAVEARLSGPRTAGAEASLAGQALPTWTAGTSASRAANDDTLDATPGASASAGDRDAVAALGTWLYRVGPGPGSGSGAGGDGGSRGGAHGPWGGTRPGFRSRAVTARDVLTGTSFALTGASKAGGGFGALWGRGAIGSFDGREGDLTLDGEVTTGLIGADWASDPGPESGAGRWIAGLAVGHSRGAGGYRSPAGKGEVEATLTGVYPYAGMDLTDRLSAWAAAGYGSGEVTVEPDGKAALKADLAMTMAAAGLRSELVRPPAAGGGLSLALKGDARFTRTSSDAAGGMAASDADVWLMRAGIEGSRRFALGGNGAALTPAFEIGMRLDGGDAEEGFGADIGGGLAFAGPGTGLALDLKARGLLAHEASGFREWGASAQLAWDPQPATDRGVSATLRQSWGASPSGGMDALLGRDTLAGLAPDGGDGRFRASSRLEGEIGYGMALFGGAFTGTPNMGFGMSDGGARDYRVGWRLTSAVPGDPGFEVSLDATRREPTNGPGSGSGAGKAEHGVMLRSSIRW